MSKPTYCQLNNMSLLSLCGDNSAEFLQGQVTCDMQTITETNASIAAHCNPKGRVVASFRIFSWQKQILLSLPHNMCTLTQTTLQKYAQFHRVNIEDVSANFAQIALFGKHAENWLKQHILPPPQHLNEVCSTNTLLLSKVTDNPPGFTLIIAHEELPRINKILEQQATLSDFHAWEYVLIQNKHCFVTPEVSALFIPQMLGFDKLGAISFDKGCYIGQEIIARTQHLGKTKRHLYQITLTSETAPRIGDALMDTDKQTVGQLTLVAPTEHNTYSALAVIQDRALQMPLFHAASSVSVLN